jgi:hypothetical protein
VTGANKQAIEDSIIKYQNGKKIEP